MAETAQAHARDDVTALAARIEAELPVYDPEAAGDALDRLIARLDGENGLADLKDLLTTQGPARTLIAAVFGASPYLSGIAARSPELLADCLLRDPDTHFDDALARFEAAMAEAGSDEAAMREARRFKSRAALLIGLADIGDVWTIDRVIERLSDVGDATLRCAVRHLLERGAAAGKLSPADPDAPEKGCGYVVLAMGKLGGRELNYSSDVDLIVLYDPDAAPVAEGVEPSTFFVRLTRDLVRFMQERTANGYVFRTDLRLRPDHGATPLAISLDAALTYYEGVGQNWERAAMIKARAVAGDLALGEAFLGTLSPFVWRKYLDYAAIDDIHAMKRRVHRHKGHGKIAVAGHNIKLGRGGIRDIEFFVQTQQLIAGGRQPELRAPRTLTVLERLAGKGWIERDTADDLSQAYRFLRRLEHRIQMIADEQTHSLPVGDGELDRIARFSGYADTDGFKARVREVLESVEGHYEALFEDEPEAQDEIAALTFTADADNPATLEALDGLGFANPETVVSTVAGWKSGRYAATRTERARDRLNEFLPLLLETLGQTADPDQALLTFDRFLSELPSGVQLFSLLCANPRLLRLVADILGSAPRLARVLSRRPRLLDAVLDPGFFGDIALTEGLDPQLRAGIAAGQDYQECLDLARIIGREQSFLIGVRVLSGTLSAEQAGAAYARLAEHLIRALQHVVLDDLASRHGHMQGGRAAVIAMGKLGGREMTASSDLDLIVVYDYEGNLTDTSDGAKPLAGGQYYARAAQRLISAISAPTAEGSLYAVDMRLRPSGNAGPVATRLDRFVSYHQGAAWTWENLALTRARVISGPPELHDAIETVIAEVLTRKRDRAAVAADARQMRALIEKEKGSGDIWDLKNVRGGLVDLEFIAQFLQLVTAHGHAQALDQNTTRALEALRDADALSAEHAGILIPAARLYHNVTQILRLCLDRTLDPGDAPRGLKDLLCRAADAPDFESLQNRLVETARDVHAAFDRIVS